MEKYIINNVITYRVDTVEAVELLHEQLSSDTRFQLTQFSYTTKYKKVKGEAPEEYQLVKAKLVFNDEKDPVVDVKVNYEVEF